MGHGARIGLWIGLGGLLLFGYAIRLAYLNSGASSHPVEVELAKLEQAGKPPDRHLKIGAHMRLYGGAIYQYDDATTKPSPSTRINYCYYPILSTTDSESPEDYNGRSRVSADKARELERVAVLVKTKEFETVGQVERLPRWQKSNGVTGLVVNDVVELAGPERSLLHKAFPQIDLDRLILLEAGRHPTSFAMLAFLWTLSLAMLATGAWLMFWRLPEPQGSTRASVPELTPETDDDLVIPADPDDPAAAWFARKAQEAKLEEEKVLRS